MSAPPIPAGLPLDDRSKDLKIPIVVLIIFSSIFVILRLCVSFRNRNFFQLTDHLLWTGHVSGQLPDISESKPLTCVLDISSCWCHILLQNNCGGRWPTCLGSNTYPGQPGDIPLLPLVWAALESLWHGLDQAQYLRLYPDS